MRRSKIAERELSSGWAVILLVITASLVLLSGWHREVVSRHPISDLPFVNEKRLEDQIESGNVSKTEAVYYRKKHAGADTTEIR